MGISSETWAIVAATGLGPILAVALTLWRENVNSIYTRRLYVFRVLMATRRINISNDHVNALNLVEVDFYKCEDVTKAWGEYKEHLNDRSRPEDDIWREKREKLLAKLLFEMGAVLKFDIPALDIFKGGYAPEGWAHRDAQQFGAYQFVNDLAKGKSCVPIWVLGMNSPIPHDEAQPPTVS